MFPLFRLFLACLPLLIFFGCSSSTGQPAADQTVSANSVLFDPSASIIPLPNILATATAKDPFMNYSGNFGPRPANKPMTPPEALAYVNKYEMGDTNAVAGLNAPIYIRVANPVIPATVSATTIKIFQLSVDTAGTENSPLGFTDISSMFTYQYKAGSTDIFAFPNFPLLPGTRYLYVVTNRVKDEASGGSVSGSFYFEALKATTPLLGAFAALEPIRANKMSGDNVLLSGYAKVMDDLVAASAATTISSRNEIALLGRFITTGAGYIPTNATNSATRIPVESALRAFAAGGLPGGLPGKIWTNTVNTPATIPAAAFWAAAGAPGTAPASLSRVVTGTINSADLSLDPVVVKANAAAGIDQSATPGAYNPAAGVVQAFRSGANLTGFYHTLRSVPFVYLAPVTPNGKAIIFQHGITGQKEQVLAVAGALTAAGYAVVAIDLPLHGALAVPTHTTGPVWGQDFMAIGAPLATRSNIQQGAFNLNRLELTLKTGGFVAAGIATAVPTEIKFAGISLGSIVGAYYLAGNTTMATSGNPYTQTTLSSDMKGLLSVPGGRTAYLIQNSPAFSPSVNAGLAAKGIATNSSTYHQFFQVTQSVVDPVDPATMTTPLATGLPSRLSGRIAIQEATSTTFTPDGTIPTNGDLVITNTYTRYFGNSLGGREVLGSAGSTVAPGFKQLGYNGATAPRIPANFMYTLLSGAPEPKIDFAAATPTATAPKEGYFQFDQTGISHGFLLDPTGSLAATGMGQKQMVFFLTTGLVVDPSSSTLPKSLAAVVPVLEREILLPKVLDILGH
jgi:pimeloyl-ACP methyl ester carboxylesterase